MTREAVAVSKAVGVTTLDGLTDVTITSAATGDVLRYNGTAWVDAVLAIADTSGLQTALDAKLGGSLGTTDNRVLRADGTGGSTAQGSAVTIDDSGNVTGVSALTAVSGSFGQAAIGSWGMQVGASAAFYASANIVNSADVSLSRASSGVWQIGNGGLNALGSLNLTNLTASGTISTTQSNIVSARNFMVSDGYGLAASGSNQFILFNGSNQVWATNGLLVRLANGSTPGPVDCGNLTASGTVTVGAGTVSAPSIAIGAGNDGFYVASNEISAAIDGVRQWRVDVQSRCWQSASISSLYCQADGLGYYSRSDTAGYRLGISDDVGFFRGSTGPTFDVRANGGIRSRNAANNADAPLSCSIATLSDGLNLASRTKTAVLASSPATNAGRFQLSDSGLVGREVYPDGTNWRYASDDSIVT